MFFFCNLRIITVKEIVTSLNLRIRYFLRLKCMSLIQLYPIKPLTAAKETELNILRFKVKLIGEVNMRKFENLKLPGTLTENKSSISQLINVLKELVFCTNWKMFILILSMKI
jgi:hypothetical protein